MNDYERIAAVIRHLDAHHTAQPALEELAGIARLSPSHFHRLFSTWAGITPKDFLQCLTHAHAKALLREGRSVMTAALEAGLSGSSRLHDLCISLEAVTPGDLKNGGVHLEIVYGLAATPFGESLLASSQRGVCHLSFPDGNAAAAIEELRACWPEAVFRRDDQAATRLAGQIFTTEAKKTAKDRSIRAFVKGTPFQVRVWRALLSVPPGHLTSYGRLAEAIGHPDAARAVGSAVGQNNLAFLIPCHRVIRETGIIGEYRWGRPRKRAMLVWEQRFRGIAGLPAPAGGRLEAVPSSL